MTDREQTRRDAEKLIAANENVVFDERGYDELRFASDCLALLAELEQAERERDGWKRRAESLAIAIEQRAREAL